MKKNNFIVSSILILILLAMSIGQYYCCPYIYKTTQEKKDLFYTIDYCLNHTAYYDYVIDFNFQKETNPQASAQQYISINSNDGELTSQEVINQETNRFIEELNQFHYDLMNEKDIYYYAIDTKTQQTASNTKDHLDQLSSDKELQNKYQLYYQIEYDEEGNYFIHWTSNENDISIQKVNEYSRSVYSGIIYEDDYSYSVSYQAPKNIIITYAIPKTLVPNSELSLQLMSPDKGSIVYALPYMFGFILLTMIMTFIFPIKYLKESRFLSFISKIKFEILSVIWCSITFFMTYFSGLFIMASENGLMNKLFIELGIEGFSEILIPTIVIVYWFIYYGLFMILAYMIKYLFHKGVKRYFIENTVIYWIYHCCIEIFHRIIQFDLNDNINKTVLKIVLFNFVIIALIISVFEYGFIFALLYSVIIFVILKKKFEDIQQDYEVLLHSTQQLSTGNFNVDINEDIGLFNPLKDEFSHIKDGFEKAVQEEVKSQKMKTELITNVSHDLKTPLTSIITYVDLLKNSDLTDEQRQQYIDILDRNSLRLKNLIDDLFEVSKANSGNIKLDFMDVDIVSLIKQAQYECADKLEEKSLDIRFNYDHEKVLCFLDSSKTYRIFENLFINISKYALAHTRVYLDILENEDNVIITFKNISEDEMKFNENEIVERFVQGDKSRNTRGSGLGLAIVKSFTELQGGTFKVEIDGDLFKTTLSFRKLKEAE